jgi:hypothetical protein
MAINLIVQPWVTIKWETFDSDAYPKFSIGVDGSVRSPSRSNDDGTKLVVDHHSGDDAVATLVRSLNKLLPGHGWTDETRQAVRELMAFTTNAESVIQRLSPETAAAETIVRAQQALKVLSPLLAVLGSDPATRARTTLGSSNMFRLSTRSACDQTLCLVNMGLYDRFRVDGEPTAHLIVNHPDEDSCFSSYGFMHPEVAHNRIFRGLVRTEDYLDMSAGLFPMNRRQREVRQLCWITQPYTNAKIRGELKSMNADQMRNCIMEVHERITATLNGQGETVEPDIRYEIISDHGYWKVVREIGAQARLGLGADGVKAFLSVREDPDGRRHAVLARLSSFVPFPCNKLGQHFNALEGIAPDNPDRWGGADTVQGSPLKAGTKQTIQELDENTERFLSLHLDDNSDW